MKKENIIKEIINYSKIAATIVVPIVAAGYNLIDKLNTRITSLENHIQLYQEKDISSSITSITSSLDSLNSWRSTIEDRKTPEKLNQISTDLLQLQLKMTSIEKDVETLKSRVDDKAKRSNIKFDEQDKRINKLSSETSYLYGFIRNNRVR